MTDDYSYETAGQGIKDEIEDEAYDLADDAQDARHRAESWFEEQIMVARDRTREEPFKALAIAAGIGAVLGAIFLR